MLLCIKQQTYRTQHLLLPLPGGSELNGISTFPRFLIKFCLYRRYQIQKTFYSHLSVISQSRWTQAAFLSGVPLLNPRTQMVIWVTIFSALLRRCLGENSRHAMDALGQRVSDFMGTGITYEALKQIAGPIPRGSDSLALGRGR